MIGQDAVIGEHNAHRRRLANLARRGARGPGGRFLMRARPRKHRRARFLGGCSMTFSALPAQLEDALWRVDSAGLEAPGHAGRPDRRRHGRLGDRRCARARRARRPASRPILSVRGYGLPPWTTPDTTVLCASYSGETEETLACYEAAGALGARRIVATTGGRLAELARADGVGVIPIPGGFQPRAALAYLLVAALEVAALCGAGPRLAAEIDVAAAALDGSSASGGPTRPRTRSGSRSRGASTGPCR